MADRRQLELARGGTRGWNAWRRVERGEVPDLAHSSLAGSELEAADLSRANLFAADLSGARASRADFNSANLMYASLERALLEGADFRQANLFAANLGHASLKGARFSGAHASGIKLRGADLTGANCFVADITRADLGQADLGRANFFGSLLGGSDFSGTRCHGADFSGADFSGALMAGTDLSGATLSDCKIKGITAVDLVLTGTVQNDLVLTGEGEPEIAVDGLEDALTIAGLLKGFSSPKNLGGATVLVLGSYPHERKGYLNGLREEIRKAGYTPLLFDLAEAGGEDYSDLVARLALLCRLVLADLGGMESLPPELRMLTETGGFIIQPILAGGASPGVSAGLADITGRDSLRPLYQTDDQSLMIMSMGLKVLAPLAG